MLTDEELKEYKHFTDIPDVIACNHLLATLRTMILGFICLGVTLAGCVILTSAPVKQKNTIIAFTGIGILIAFTVVMFFITRHNGEVLMDRYYAVKLNISRSYAKKLHKELIRIHRTSHGNRAKEAMMMSRLYEEVSQHMGKDGIDGKETAEGTNKTADQPY